ncbi:P-loop containing nucleoside triphosphate hydrolase protein [Peniophora sp. CONT]|nr:P-loop containing nucleoside triphosphate hydrolase protein [Peniophora sp. CONT]
MTVDSSPDQPVTPRKYQEEILQHALKGNVIAALKTGSGKTYIAVLLIRYICSLPSSQGKKIVFIVPTVPLVLQQAEYIKKHVPSLHVARAHGGRVDSIVDRAAWRENIRKSDVLVSTAQIFLNLLTHSHLSMDRVSFLVLDECHHARRNHPYNRIMNEYHHCDSALRPKIFGMTASVSQNKDAQKSIADLERNLDATVFAVKEHRSELDELVPEPKLQVLAYTCSPDYTTIAAYPELPRVLCDVVLSTLQDHVDTELAEQLEKMANRYHTTYGLLGYYAAEMGLYTDLSDVFNEVLKAVAQIDTVTLRRRYLEGSVFPGSGEGPTPVIDECLYALHDVLREHDHYFSSPVFRAPLWPFSIEWISPRLQNLVDLLIAKHTPALKGMIFVQERHTAVFMTEILNRTPALQDLIKARYLVGIGQGSGEIGGRTMSASEQRRVVEAFRGGDTNLIIATDVAEEGLDFPACDLVVRYEPLTSLKGFIQSRGRARKANSTFVVMIQQDTEDLAQLEALIAREEESKALTQEAQLRLPPLVPLDSEDGEEDMLDGERFVVPTTGAVLTYSNAISLLERLFSLIPREPFTPDPKPSYTIAGSFECTLELPASAIPLPLADRTFHGPEMPSKRQARNAAAFMAVRRLHELDIFDAYLLPSRRHGGQEDAFGRPLVNVADVPPTMDVKVRSPWTLGPKLWVHALRVDGQLVAGLITGSILPPVDMTCDGSGYRTGDAVPVSFDEAGEWKQREMLQRYTDVSIWWTISSRPRPDPLACYVVPVRDDLQPDFDAIEQMLRVPYGSFEWAPILDALAGRVLVRHRFQHGRTYLLHAIRHDLTPLSTPPDDAREAGYSTYKEYLVQKLKARNIDPEQIPSDGPLIEVHRVNKQVLGSFDIGPDGACASNPPFIDPRPYFLPIRACTWSTLSEPMFNLYRALPRLLRFLTSVYRARAARFALGLPAISDLHLVEAHTVPNAMSSFSNQRLETLGDLVLKVATSVHLFNRFPACHEGQLDRKRSICIRNTTLLAHAKQIDLEQFLTAETQDVRTWPYITISQDPEEVDRRVKRIMPRRCLQDCMEATLGAAWLSGGMDFALQTGTALGLEFGGTIPWSLRYSRDPEPQNVPPIFCELQERLCYWFHRPDALREALTHPTWSSDCISYQRLEFLGDALLDLPIMDYLYHKFPAAKPGQLSTMRESVICAPVLAWLAVTKLSLDTLILVNNVELSLAIEKYAVELRSLSAATIVRESWAHDPPKALSDVLESVVAAVLLDSAYNLERVNAVVTELMREVLEELRPDMQRDPVSRLMVWTAKQGCRKMQFQKSRSALRREGYDTAGVVVHGVSVGEPVQSSSLSVSKAFASNQALKRLQDSEQEHSLKRLCNCTREDAGSNDLGIVLAIAPQTAALPLPQATSTHATGELAEFDDGDHEDLDDGTAAGFAGLAQQKLLAERETGEGDLPKHENDDEAGSEAELGDSDLQLDVDEGMDIDVS